MARLKGHLRRFWDRQDDSGVAIILVVIWSLGLVLLALVVSTAAVNSIRSSDRSEHYFDALAAAESGVDDFMARLAADDRYYQNAYTDSTNLALTEWVDVPGGDSQAQFTYVIDDSKLLSDGELSIISTGRALESVRTIKTVLRRPSSADAMYLSGYETQDPDMPGVYPAGDIDRAKEECAERYWWEKGGDGNYRPTFCLNQNITENDLMRGPGHTNDIWYVDKAGSKGNSLASTFRQFKRDLTTACPTTPENPACDPAHMWVQSGTAEITPTDVANNGNANWNPQAAPLQAGGSGTSKELFEIAKAGGCVFYGPTRIRLITEEIGGVQSGYVEVTSPNTKNARQSCGGTSLTANTDPNAQTTVKMPLSAVANGVIYVAGTPADTADLNHWTTGTEPSCQTKTSSQGGKNYPYVIPASNSVDQSSSHFQGQPGNGFPSPQYGGAPEWFGCDRGIVFLEGALTGKLTIVAEQSIFLTGHTMYGDTKTSGNPNGGNVGAGQYGVVDSASENLLGLVATSYIATYNPVTNMDPAGYGKGTKVTDWDAQKGKIGNSFEPDKQWNVIYNFSAITLQGCFGSMYYAATGSGSGANEIQTDLGRVFMMGSIGTKYGCLLGQSEPYPATYPVRVYRYDDRLRYMTAPYMQTLVSTSWEQSLIAETNNHRVDANVLGLVSDSGTQKVSSVQTWDVLANDVTDNGGILRLNSAEIVTPDTNATVAVVDGKLVVTAPATPMTIEVRYNAEALSGLNADQSIYIKVTAQG